MTKGKWAVFLFYEVIKGSYGSYQSAVDNKNTVLDRNGVLVRYEGN